MMSRAKKIMFSCNGLSGGGAERVVSILASSFVEVGYETAVLMHANIPVTYDIDSRVKIIPTGNSFSGMRRRLEQVRNVRKACRSFRPDVVISFSTNNALPTLLGTPPGVKNVVSERNDPASLVGIPKNIMRRILYAKADYFVFQTEDARNYFPRAIRVKSSVILNPLKNEMPEPWEGMREKRVVSLCRLEPQKNLKMLIDAFQVFHRTHPDWKLDIYGDGSQREMLGKYISDLGINEAVCLHYPENDVHSIVLKAGMFVLASDYEGLSNSMLEALALGLPTICTDCPCGGARMVIKDGVNGFLVPVSDVASLAKVMNYLGDHPEIAKRIGANATSIRKQLDACVISKQWDEIVKGLL